MTDTRKCVLAESPHHAVPAVPRPIRTLSSVRLPDRVLSRGRQSSLGSLVHTSSLEYSGEELTDGDRASSSEPDDTTDADDAKSFRGSGLLTEPIAGRVASSPDLQFDDELGEVVDQPNTIANCNHTATAILNTDLVVVFGGVAYSRNATRLFRVCTYRATLNRPYPYSQPSFLTRVGVATATFEWTTILPPPPDSDDYWPAPREYHTANCVCYPTLSLSLSLSLSPSPRYVRTTHARRVHSALGQGRHLWWLERRALLQRPRGI